MKVIVCIDDNKGMLFNARRQSRDKAVIEDVMKQSEKVWIHSFSEKLFTDYEAEITIDDEFLKKAGKGESCFVENQALKSYEDEIEQLIVYKWNRKYPADFLLDLELDKWQLIEETEFVGSSHEKITKEIYKGRV